jgi:predicted alpha/beta-hydrolase family hydrolase
VEFLIDGPGGKPTFLFAHGAGGPMDTPFMNRVAAGLAARGIQVVRFEFPYMAARRHGGRRGAPDREPVLLDAWREAVAARGLAETLFIGGKSLGGRMATLVADELGVRGVICFGYPFHPPGKPERLRTRHLETLRTPALILQGELDPFGNREEVATYKLSEAIRVEWLADGDHSFKPRARSGTTEAANLDRAIALAASSFL